MLSQQSKLLAAWISLISNFILTVLKIVVGAIFHSTALIADGVHNGGDVIASIATLSSMKLSHQPADKEHPYGHGKAEDIASGIIAIILGIAALFLIYESVLALFEPAIIISLWALIAAFVSLVWKYILYIYTIKIGKRDKSKSLIATAYDHLADVYASLAAVIGLGIAWIGDMFNISLASYGDPIAGIIVSILILKVAFNMGVESVNVLMESNVSQEKQDEFSDIILSFSEVKRIDRLRAREHGNYILVDVRISVPGNMTIQEGHDVTKKIKNTIMEKNQDVEEVLIHLNPWYPENRANR
ncbi:cation diffusion facilitator family transporter [Scopulibacillus daqui]|uniref:Cation diffusion facilitator family transporter n=2 Tax=Scopulibacillus daqui TaxID=1469162 RepID=A0ABS2Q1E1_9BACL|nr:cation diffusion facilitator family transporter [Scopulibacillus daqui]MBM7645514.1 cation diffusion facilitator family transporter [Scopulibacillus daqui]